MSLPRDGVLECPNSLGESFVQKLYAGVLIAGFFAWMLLGAAIYFYGLYLAGASAPIAIIITSLVPLIGQAYWIWVIWTTTGVFFNSYLIAFLSWIALGVLLGNIVERRR